MKPGVVPIPLLPLLALVHGVEEVRAGEPDGCVPDRPKVRSRQRRLGKEEVADRRMRRPCELLKLLQRRLLRPVLPLFERREASEELLRGLSRAFTRPRSASLGEPAPGCSSPNAPCQRAGHGFARAKREGHAKHRLMIRAGIVDVPLLSRQLQLKRSAWPDRDLPERRAYPPGRKCSTALLN